MEIIKYIVKEFFGNNPLAGGLFLLAGLLIYIRIKFSQELKFYKKIIDDLEKKMIEKQNEQDQKTLGFMREVNDGFRACNEFSLKSLEKINDRLFKITEDLGRLTGGASKKKDNDR